MSGHDTHGKPGVQMDALGKKIGEVETEAEAMTRTYDDKIAELRAKGRDKTSTMKLEYEKKAADAKGAVLSAERGKIEHEAAGIIAEGKKGADGFRAKKATDKALLKIAEEFISSL
jgi:hypothetical protein